MNNSLPTLQDLIYFVIVGQSLSLTSASKSSGIPIATLSRKISALEKRMNARLMIRSPRGIILTDIGKYLLKRADIIIQDAISLESEIKNIHGKPAGLLRVSVPVDFGISFISPLMNDFSNSYPDIKFDFDLSPSKVKIKEQRIDVSIRIGSINDISLVARPVGFVRRKLYASSAYISNHSTINHPSDLGSHTCILPSYMKNPGNWTLHNNDEVAKVTVNGIYAANNISMMLKLAENDGGIAVLTPEVIRTELTSGTIVPVLKDWSFSPLPVYIITESRNIPQSTRLFVDYLTRKLGEILGST